jgi:type VI secretion system protein ImpM
MSESFETGWYGKLPAHGDFVTRRLPPSFIELWDAWLNAMLLGSRERLGAGWRDAFLSAPSWRFVLAPGVVGQQGWAGVMVPSVDSVGRYFPLTVASALPSKSLDPATTVVRAHNWYGELEPLAYAALSPEAEMETFDAQLRNRRFPADLRGLAKPLAEPYSAWLAEESEIFGRSLMLCEKLPGVEQFCAMLNGEWSSRPGERRSA